MLIRSSNKGIRVKCAGGITEEEMVWDIQTRVNVANGDTTATAGQSYNQSAAGCHVSSSIFAEIARRFPLFTQIRIRVPRRDLRAKQRKRADAFVAHVPAITFVDRRTSWKQEENPAVSDSS